MGEREGERAAKRGTEPKGGNRKASKEGGDRCGDRLVRTRVARVFRLFCARERKKERKKEEKNETGFFVQGGEERRRRTSATMQSAQDQQLKTFWDQQMQEVKEVPTDTSVFKNHQLPLARIKKIMKSDEDVRMISAEAPVLFAKACELFILELTLRSWMHSEESKRRTLQRNDIAAAITKTDVFDFLLDIVPREEAKEEAVRLPSNGGAVPPAGMYASMPYAYMQQGMPGGEGYPNVAAAAMQQQLYGQYVPGQFPMAGVQQEKKQ